MNYTLNEYHRNVSDEEYLKDVSRVARIIKSDTLTMDEYRNNGGKFHPSSIRRRFGGWINVLKKCGLSPQSSQITNHGIDDEALINDLQDVSVFIGKKTFTSSEYAKFGKYYRSTYSRRFGSWNNALEAAGLVPFDHPLGGGSKNKISEDECFEEIEHIWIELGRQPTTTDIKSGCGKYSLHVYERRFGSWRMALEAFVSFINNEQEPEKTDRNNERNEISNFVDEVMPMQVFSHMTKRDIGLRLRFLVMKRDNFKCCICGRSPATTPGLELHIDHIIPWSKGGETVIDNLQTLCSDCNLGKSDLSLDEN